MRVSIQPCSSYDLGQVMEAVRRGVFFATEGKAPFKKGQRILLKVNLLSDKEPERAVTTHPALVETMILLVKEAGAVPVVGDSPFPFIPFERVAKKTGMAALCRKHGVELLALDGPTRVPSPSGYVVKTFFLTRHLEGFDAVIDMPKLKTHSFMVYTGAVKNLFGLVSGKEKPAFHLRFQNERHFGLMLLDLHRLMKKKVVLTVMDAVVGMEGSGPLNGTPRELGYILVGDDPLAVDTVASSMVKLKVPYLASARQKGLPGAKLEDIIIDRDIEKITIPGFVPPRKALNLSIITSVRNLFVPYPVLVKESCIGCKRCFHSCPSKAISFKSHRPVFDYAACIRCYCCQEMCPEKAIRLKRPLLARMLFLGKKDEGKP